MSDAIGEGTTTLDMLYHNHPWLKKLIEEKDAKIALLVDIVADYRKRAGEKNE